MKLYRVYTDPDDLETHNVYLVWADNELTAQVEFRRQVGAFRAIYPATQSVYDGTGVIIGVPV